MKKRMTRTLAGLIVLAAFTLPACEFLEDCGQCEFVEDDGTDITVLTPALIYCGESYQEKLNSEPVTVAGVTTYWDCY
ncbi:MAG: hypothetical protein K9G38_01675 [Bacteroidales bacterium]|nr:hypothetical protein [Bacteroidales bacterium]